LNDPEITARVQEATSYVLRGFELLKECAQETGSSELVDLIQKQIEAFGEITKVLKPH
jgi:hypothetical protein